MLRPSIILIALLLAVGHVPPPAVTRAEIRSPAQPQGKPPAAPRKRALLVGVSDYCRDATGRECNDRQDGKYWWNLNSAADVDAIEQVLRSDRFGFQPHEIKVLKTKEETTCDSIVSAFKSFLAGQTGPGDIVYFHFSGHGSQVKDDAASGNLKRGDELDGADETLIPSDYVTRDDGEKNIRDDDLEQLLASLAGRHVTVTVDSCFSGTITRGGRNLVRGMRLRGVAAANSRGAKDGPSGLFQEGAGLPGNLVAMSAASKDQLATETEDGATKKKMGAFSLSLVTALRKAGPEMTYRDLFETVDEEITREHRGQNPQLEGGRDNVLFSGIARRPQPYVTVGVEGRKVLLRAGSLQGMTAGSRFSIYPPGKDPKTGTPMSQAEIINVGPTASVLKITPEPDDAALEQLRAARAVETFHNFGDVRLKVVVEDGAKAALGDEGLRELKAHALLSVVDNADAWDARLCRDRCQNELQARREAAGFSGGVTLMRADGSIIGRLASGQKMAAAVGAALEGEARWRFVKGLKNDAQRNLQIRMRLVPVRNIVQDPVTRLAKSAEDIAPEVLPGADGRIALHDGDTVMLEVMNLGTTDVYVSVLDLRSSGDIGPLYPHPLVRAGVNENVIGVKNDSAGRPVWQRIPCPFVIKIGEPYGLEVFKAIVTRGRADFSPLFSRGEAEAIQRGRTRGTTRGEDEAKSPLGQILLTFTTGQTRGKLRGDVRGETGLFGAADAASVGVPAEDWTTAEITFEARGPREASAPAGSPPKQDTP